MMYFSFTLRLLLLKSEKIHLCTQTMFQYYDKFYQYLCWIVTFLNSAFLNGFVALGHSLQRSKHLFMDIEIHNSSMLVSDYSPSCYKNFIDIYIVVWQNKWFKQSTFYIVMYNFMSHCDVYQGLHFIATLTRVISHYDVKPWFVCLVGICQHNQRCDTLIMW